jgi:hypothetical protein
MIFGISIFSNLCSAWSRLWSPWTCTGLLLLESTALVECRAAVYTKRMTVTVYTPTPTSAAVRRRTFISVCVSEWLGGKASRVFFSSFPVCAFLFSCFSLPVLCVVCVWEREGVGEREEREERREKKGEERREEEEEGIGMAGVLMVG